MSLVSRLSSSLVSLTIGTHVILGEGEDMGTKLPLVPSSIGLLYCLVSFLFSRNFIPSPGHLHHLVTPQASDVVRIDTGVRQGERGRAHHEPSHIVHSSLVKFPHNTHTHTLHPPFHIHTLHPPSHTHITLHPFLHTHTPPSFPHTHTHTPPPLPTHTQGMKSVNTMIQ